MSTLLVFVQLPQLILSENLLKVIHFQFLEKNLDLIYLHMHINRRF